MGSRLKNEMSVSRLKRPSSARRNIKHETFSPFVSGTRLRRVQSLLGSSNTADTAQPDSILCIAGIDSRYNDGMLELINYLLFGFFELRKAELESSGFDEEIIDDILFLIQRDKVDVYCNPINYHYLLPYVSHWKNVFFHCLSEEQYDDEEKAEDFKINTFVSIVKDCKRIGIPYSSSVNPQAFEKMAIEKWPIIQVYGVEGVGGGGFFTMIHEVEDISKDLRHIYDQMDPVALETIIIEQISKLEHQWNTMLTTIEFLISNDTQLTEDKIFEPLKSYYLHGCASNLQERSPQTPFVLYGPNSSRQNLQTLNEKTMSTSNDLNSTPVSKLGTNFMVCRAVSPRGPISCTRTYFFTRDFINPFQEFTDTPFSHDGLQMFVLMPVRCKDAVAAGKLNAIDISLDDGKWFQIAEKKVKEEKEEAHSGAKPAVPPITGWKPFPSVDIPSNFNYGHIYHYLLESVVLIGQGGNKEDANLSHMTSKPLTKGEQYVKSGSVTDIVDCIVKGNYFVKANVAASMRKDIRHVTVSLSDKSGAVLDASCTCPGSALGRCNHVAAVLLMVLKHCQEHGYQVKSCTSKPCEWNKGQKRQKTPGKVVEAQYDSYKPKRLKLSEFDPRPTELRGKSLKNVNNFIRSMKYVDLKRKKLSMWSTLFVPSFQDYDMSDECASILRTQVWDLFLHLQEEWKNFGKNVYMIPGTESQSDSLEWKSCRWFRITASNAKLANNLGNLLISTDVKKIENSRFTSFIKNHVWEMSQFQSSDMSYGLENEAHARDEYQSLMKEKHPEIKVEKTGFWVNKMWPELGCSPDGFVMDPTEPFKHGLIEIKCLKIFKTISPHDLFSKLKDGTVKKSSLYQSCFASPIDENSVLSLKTNHAYYFQIQLQLAITDCHWCDFVLWSPVGKPSIERIRRDDQLISNLICNVTALWHRVVAPELFEMRVPRRLNPFIVTD